MRKISLLLAAVTCFAFFSNAQVDKKKRTGLVFDDAEYNSSPMQSKFAGSKFSELPLKVSLRKWTPTPGDQGEIGSCVGWSTCYGALSTQYAIRNKWTDKKIITQHAFSGLFLYNLVMATEADCDGGTRIPIAMTKLQKTGSCYHKDFIRDNCSASPPDSLQKMAKQFAIQDFMGLYTTIEEDRVKIQKTKQSLAENKPVVVGMTLLENFMDISTKDPVWHTDKGSSWPLGGHAMCIIGYDEGKEAFEVMNSWGSDWADSGYCWIKYTDFAKYVRYGFQMLLKPEVVGTSSPNQQLGGDFVFQYLKDRSTLTFEPVKPQLMVGGYYTLEKKDWKVGDLFQLVAKNTQTDEYVYVFSIDSKQEAHVHFPRTSNLSLEYEGFNETPLVPISNAQIIIPTPQSALSIAQAGTDNLIVLFSKTRIDDIKSIIDQVKKAPSMMVYMELRKALGTRMVKSSDVKYEQDKMSFASTAPPDAIVPLVLTVTSK